MVEDGRHLLNCLRYVDLNMVRAGVVVSPAKWRWCGYDEVCGNRQRYRIIDRERLAQAVGVAGVDALRELHRERIEDILRRKPAQREPQWTDALAVGSASFVQIAQQDLARQRYTFVQWELETRDGLPTHVLQEPAVPYNRDSDTKSVL